MSGLGCSSLGWPSDWSGTAISVPSGLCPAVCVCHRASGTVRHIDPSRQRVPCRIRSWHHRGHNRRRDSGSVPSVWRVGGRTIETCRPARLRYPDVPAMPGRNPLDGVRICCAGAGGRAAAGASHCPRGKPPCLAGVGSRSLVRSERVCLRLVRLARSEIGSGKGGRGLPPDSAGRRRVDLGPFFHRCDYGPLALQVLGFTSRRPRSRPSPRCEYRNTIAVEEGKNMNDSHCNTPYRPNPPRCGIAMDTSFLRDNVLSSE